MNPNWQSILQVRPPVSLASSLFPPWTATLTFSFLTLSLVCRILRPPYAVMASFLPQTPSRKPSSPFSFSPSVSQYLNYAYSSPTPLPTNNSHVPTEISPYQYQLAHLGSRAPIPDASSALKTGCRDFGTLTVAETLLSVHSGVVSSSALPTPPPSNPSSLVGRRLFVGEELQTPSRLIWSSKHSSSSFVSPSKQQQAGSFSHHDSFHRKSNGFASFSTTSMSFSSSFEQGSSSQSSSQLTSVGWQEPRTPRSSERRRDFNREKQGILYPKNVS